VITRQQRALLAGFLASFNMAAAARIVLRANEPPRPVGYVQELIEAMETEIAGRITLARRALAGFPQRSRVGLLQAIPSLIVEPTVRAARPARTMRASHDVRACEP
jgi:hypothetical protein